MYINVYGGHRDSGANQEIAMANRPRSVSVTHKIYWMRCVQVCCVVVGQRSSSQHESVQGYSVELLLRRGEEQAREVQGRDAGDGVYLPKCCLSAALQVF